MSEATDSAVALAQWLTEHATPTNSRQRPLKNTPLKDLVLPLSVEMLRRQPKGRSR